MCVARERVVRGGVSVSAPSPAALEADTCSLCRPVALEWEFEVLAPAVASLTRAAPVRRLVLEPLAPRVERLVGKGGVVLIPLHDELSEGFGAQVPHLSAGAYMAVAGRSARRS